ncbi:EF-hand domain-containing family member B [Apteryx rowi]|uniref:EF-hand domain-containing family member B n=1 Tax=Apteryx rowi TaxID=308060 RepID=UPI000E1E1264|nr:EF-hand domain-containing family member B [Apteryx rowi]
MEQDVIKFRYFVWKKGRAGKLIPTGDTAAGCLTEVLPRPITPIIVRKFRNTINPAPGVERVFYGRADDPDIAAHLTHGFGSRSSLATALLINPLPKTNFQQRIHDKKEAIYFSNRQAALGRSHDQTPMLPTGFDITNTTFGRTVIQDVSGGELINPPKTFEEVDREAREGHDLYIMSHNDYYVGEAINRKHDSPNFDRSCVFGKETPRFEDGRNVSRSLNWLLDLKKKAAKIVSKRSDDFKEKFQPQLGKVLDLRNMNVPPGHTFGMLLHPDEYGVGDLLHCRVPSEFLRGKDRERAVLTAVRQNLKKASYHNFDTLLEAFRHYNKNGDGMIDKDDLQKSCFQLNLNIDDELLDALFDCCDLDKDGLINYLEFANFLNWKDKMAVKEFEEKIITKGIKPDTSAPALCEDKKTNDEPLLKQEDLVLKEPGSLEKTPKPLTRPTDHVFSDYQTTSSQYNAVAGGLPTTYYPVCGVPTIRSDIPGPRICHISDRANYGDEGNAYALLCPSVFSQKGVYERDFFRTRPKAEIEQILRNIGVNISDESFEEIWKQACKKHQRGEVCVESIRNVLDEIHASHTKNSS